jgi:UTP--glucose-1-phosphate uridylyltransferase
LHFYRENHRLVEYLDRHGKQYLYSQVERLHTKAEFIFVRQPDEGEYGTAVPLKLAQPYLQDEEAFFVFMGDDFLFGSGQTSESANMLKLYQDSGASGLMTCIAKPTEELSRYGVIKANSRNQFQFLESIVEKPAVAEAPSNLINVSKYIMKPEVFDLVNSQEVDPKSGELYITDSLINWAKTQPVVIYQPEGEYLDGGNPEEWLKANITVASADPKLKQLMTEWLN